MEDNTKTFNKAFLNRSGMRNREAVIIKSFDKLLMVNCV
jgi:hypothetical protein